MLSAIVLCHNVTPVEDNGERTFQASSPDEIALVKFADELDFKLLERDSNNMKIINPNGDYEDYQILAIFPFSSQTKRMGIIVKHIETNRILFFLKGAEISMISKVNN